jgi:membrane protein required for colicin V production
MNPADGVILAVIAISVLLGVFRGLVREAFSLAGWVAAFLVARLFHAPFEAMLAGWIATPSLRMVAAYGGLFAMTLLLSSLLGYVVMSLMEMAGVRAVDRLLGAVFGLVRGLILVLVLLVTVAPLTARDPWWHEAQLPRLFMHYEWAGRELRDMAMRTAQKAASGTDAEQGGEMQGTADVPAGR